MKRKYLLIPLVILIAAFILIQCSPNKSSSVQDGQALLQGRCTKCHSLDPITSQTHTQDEWTQIVNNMVQRGAVLSSTEETTLINYLTATYGK